MENLQPGVILNLLSNMAIQEKTVLKDLDDDNDHNNRPVLLQITSIIPVLSESDNLWPKQGFFIKVSDSTHQIFVSLPQEQDEMILNNELQIGQFIHVERFESAYPVPLLKGLRPNPGRKAFDGDFKQLVGIDIMEALSQTSPFQRAGGSISGPYKTPLKDRRASIGAPLRDRRASIGGQECRTRAHGLDHQGFDIGCSRKKQGLDGSSCGRRSWCETAKTRTRRVHDSMAVKHEIIPVFHSSNSRVPQLGSARSFTYKDDNSNTKSEKKTATQSSKQVKTTNKSCNSSSARTTSTSTSTTKEPLIEARKIGSSSNQTWSQTELLWDALPSSLVELGTEALRQRDVTLLAAVDALQEAAATERLLECLSKFSELRLAKEDDQKPSINKFLKLQDHMARCRMIVQSLTNISPRRMADCDLSSPGSNREALKLAVERSRNAIEWIKAAVASDLVPLHASGTKEGENESKNTKKLCRINMLKGDYTITKQRNNDESHCDFESEKENTPDWVKGSALNMVRNLADALQDECTAWFLAYMENYLDGFDNECFSTASHSQVAESMCRIKRLNDWLDVMEGSNGNSTTKSSDFEAYRRVRNKLYEVLLKHVERTAMVLENMDA